MSIVEQWLLDFEQEEENNDMYFSLYAIPAAYNEEEV